MGYVPTEFAAAGTELEIEINGVFYATKVIDQALYDPQGQKMRS